MDQARPASLRFPDQGHQQFGPDLGQRSVGPINPRTHVQNTHAWLTKPNAEDHQDLGTLGCDSTTAVGITDSGQVAGSSQLVPGQANQRAFITGPNGVGLSNLAQEVSLPENVPLRVAVAINDKGQVVGQDVNNKHYLLTPVP